MSVSIARKSALARVLLAAGVILFAAGCKPQSPPFPRLGKLVILGPIGVDNYRLELAGQIEGAQVPSVLVGRVEWGKDAAAKYVDNVRAKVDESGRFNAAVSVKEGDNTIAVLLGGSPIGLLQLNIDNKAPRIHILEPGDKHRTAEATIRVRGQAIDRNLTLVQVNGKNMNVDDEGMFQGDIPLPNVGENVIEAGAWDAVGNAATFSIRVYRQAPGSAQPD